jgi:hypothetical protein
MNAKHLAVVVILGLVFLVTLAGDPGTAWDLGQVRASAGARHQAVPASDVPILRDAFSQLGGSIMLTAGESQEAYQPGNSTTDPNSIPKGPGQRLQVGALGEAPFAVSGFANSGFENGPDGSWQELSVQGWPLILVEDYLLTPPHGGRWAVWLGGDDNEIAYIRQTVTIPAIPEEAVLYFWGWIASKDSCGNDFGGVVVNDDTVVGILDLCEAENTGRWVKYKVGLSAYAGQTVPLQIRAETNGSLNSNLFVDDVTLGTREYRVLLPAMLRQGGAVIPFAPPCSAGNAFCEQFNGMTTAYGPLKPGQAYTAYPNDANDYYYVKLTRTSTLDVAVSNFQADGQVLVRRPDKSEIGKDFNKPPGGDGQMSVRIRDLPAGTYYIQVYTGSGHNQSNPYTLTATH